ncbi:unnamed protein product [Phytomonas sp. EM1]|nr:unnamed protein product [Phytomonas sp. EM1]|eukprot:CCW60828.1 unnamed protein product [Phytomonas sp. isolate EM1]
MELFLPPSDSRVNKADATSDEILELIRLWVRSKNPDGDQQSALKLIEHIRKGNAEVVLDIIKDNFKHAHSSIQLRMLALMDKCVQNSGPYFTVLLASEKWTERFFRVAKTTQVPQVRDKIITMTIMWYKRHHTKGHERLLHRFANSKVLGAPYRDLEKDIDDKSMSSHTLQPPQNVAMQNFDNVNVNPNYIINNEETMILAFQGDLASLEYGLEHPQILENSDIAQSCRDDKHQCMQMLESGIHERIAPELMSLIEGFSVALELYEAMTGVDLGEGEAARQRAVDEDLAEPDSDDDEHQRRIRQKVSVNPMTTGQAIVNAQQEMQQTIDREHAVAQELRRQYDDLLREHEQLQNKYKDAKAKSRETVALLNEYAERVDNLEKGVGVSSALASPPAASSAPASQQISLAQASLMRDCTQAISRDLRKLKEQCNLDITRECQFYSGQLLSVLASIMQASEKDRSADQKALEWTQELYKKEMKLRKQYYNTIQELKGSIRVYCRVRPMLLKEIQSGYTDIMSYPATDELGFIDSSGRPKLFEFDEVYPPDASQTKVFEDTSPLIDSVVDGYNVCIFAYGQTGSGKTYTMGGDSGDAKGINTRALERLFTIIEERKETEVSTVHVSVLEIYCEQIRDLLVSRSEAAGITYEVKQGGPYGTYVTNLKELTVSSASEIDNIMQKASKHRSEGTTNMNEYSSRSHMILYVIVRTTNRQTNMQSYGKLSLVDLAGSERLEKSGAEGQLMKEAVSINKSLSSLGDVISGLANNNKHIPFRNSILTYLLQDSMAGQAKVLMFVCVSPASYNASESGSSLMFASRARGVEFGQIKKNAVVGKKV